MDDLYVYLVDLPENVDEMITPCEGGYTLYLDRKLPESKAIKAFHHAVNHIASNDWQKDSIQEIESDSHERSENSLPISKVLVRIPN